MYVRKVIESKRRAEEREQLTFCKQESSGPVVAREI
jgi:hypothetical protein